MSFIDKARAAASELAAKADTAMQQAGLQPGAQQQDGDRLLRDFGVLAYVEATGRTLQPGDKERVLGELRRLESEGRLTLSLSPPPAAGTAPGGAPPPPGAAAAAHQSQQAQQGAHPHAPQQMTPEAAAPQTAATDEAEEAGGSTGSTGPVPPPPPPPSWA